MMRFYDFIGRIEAVVAGSFLILMTALIFTGGLARFFGHPQNWTIDVATCLFAWSCFLAADVAWRRNSMMALDVVTQRLPEKTQKALSMINYLLIVAFLLFLMYYGFYLTWISRIRSFQGIPWVSYSWVTVSLPVGATLLLATTILRIRAELRGEYVANTAVDVV
ncbi:TRAP-type C4-dicarboxylate transport system, small permease component [Xaviernesmea oryzae]|uniref:TRAP transporter small permease protein n=1 Tax=Xaviernesmea oryzae TaxID=464029 RepID=A0A1X7ENL6_9HYPH|nr:TRAP transporter small permease [Xaviernesmea oryzae]SMF36730.1 TRAP-type C4-dicarboxylate transport system, small permease component [Xaviernesmea oryzae]